MNPRYHVLSFVLICGVAVPGQALAGSGKGNCQDIPLQLTISPVQSDGSGYPGIYGDAGPASPAVYTDSRGVYAKFQICNGTNDFILNLGRPSTRFFNVDFSGFLLQGDGSVQPSGPVQAWFVNLDHAAISNTGTVPITSNTLMNISTKGAGAVVYCGPQQPPYAAFNNLCSVANVYSGTSFVQVTVAPGCASWTIAPMPFSSSGSPLNGFPVAGLSRSDGTSGGYYNMPFSMTLTRIDGKAGCTGLAQ